MQQDAQQPKTKVLFLITKSNWGGAQRYVFDLATALDPDKYEPVVALGGDGELQTKLEQAGVRTIRLNSLQRDISITKEFKFAWELWRLLRTERPQVFHVNSSKAGGLGCCVGRLAFVPKVIFTAHGWAFNEDRPTWQKPIIKLLHWLTVFLSHKTIAVSNTIRKQLNWPLIKNRWVIVHNGRQPIEFVDRSQARETLHIASEGIITGTIGELHPVKQHDVMIKAVATLKQQGVHVSHVIIGAGEAEADLHAEATELGISDQIIFTGAIPEAARYLQAFDIYIQPSRSEALAYTVIEATQAGLPIIVSNVGGLPEIITHESNGLLVPSGDVAALTDSVQRMIDDQNLRNNLAKAALATSQKFSFQYMFDKTVAIYETDSSTTASSS